MNEELDEASRLMVLESSKWLGSDPARTTVLTSKVTKYVCAFAPGAKNTGYVILDFSKEEVRVVSYGEFEGIVDTGISMNSTGSDALFFLYKKERLEIPEPIGVIITESNCYVALMGSMSVGRKTHHSAVAGNKVFFLLEARHGNIEVAYASIPNRINPNSSNIDGPPKKDYVNVSLSARTPIRSDESPNSVYKLHISPYTYAGGQPLLITNEFGVTAGVLMTRQLGDYRRTVSIDAVAGVTGVFEKVSWGSNNAHVETSAGELLLTMRRNLGEFEIMLVPNQD